jgi:leucyl aminopeptidase (aminopeptidase T)
VSGNQLALVKGASHLLQNSAGLSQGASAILIFDNSTRSLAGAFYDAAKSLKIRLSMHEIPVAKHHGEEPPDFVSDLMSASESIIALTAFSFAHSKARLVASEKGASFLSLPQYSDSLLRHPMTSLDYRALSPLVRYFSDAFTAGSQARLSNAAGTDLVFNLEGRTGNYCPAFISEPGQIASPPDVEANVSPREYQSEGIAVVDGSITHPTIGILRTPVRITFERGYATSFESEEALVQESLSEIFEGKDKKRRILAELGIGLNPLAELTGVMLSDEGTLGTAHLGLGSNFSVGGKNQVDFHLDFVIRDVCLWVDDNQLIKHGTVIGGLQR